MLEVEDLRGQRRRATAGAGAHRRHQLALREVVAHQRQEARLGQAVVAQHVSNVARSKSPFGPWKGGDVEHRLAQRGVGHDQAQSVHRHVQRGLGDQLLQRLAGDPCAFRRGVPCRRTCACIAPMAAEGFLHLGGSMVWPPTLATRHCVPALRTTSPMPHRPKAATSTRKKQARDPGVQVAAEMAEHQADSMPKGGGTIAGRAAALPVGGIRYSEGVTGARWREVRRGRRCAN